MTALDLLRACVRRWRWVVLGLTVTMAVMYASKPETVYWANVPLTVVSPPDPLTPKTLEDTGSDPVAAATMLMQLVNGGHPQPKSTSPDATLYGEGKRSAVTARLRDTGGQWSSRVSNPIIDVQAVDRNPLTVVEKLKDEQALLDRQLTQLQDDLDVVPSQRLALNTPPTPANVWQVSGSRIRALASTFLVGVALTLTLVFWLEAMELRGIEVRAALLRRPRRRFSP